MLTFFRNNQVVTTLPLALYAILLHLPGLLGWVPVRFNNEIAPGILYSTLFFWAKSSPFFSALAAAILVFIQALLVNWLVHESKVTQERNWIQAMIYVLVASALPDFQYLSPALVATTFIPLSLIKIFQVYKSVNTNLLAIDAGFWIAIGALFYPPFIWLLPGFFIGMIGIKLIRLNEQVVFAISVVLPLFLGWTVAFWNDWGGDFMRQHVSSLFKIWNFDWDMSDFTLVRSGFMVFLILIVLLSFASYYNKKLMQVQKYINAVYWLLLFATITSVLSNELCAEHFILTAPSLGILLGMSFQEIRRAYIAEILHLCLIAGAAGVLLSQYL